MRILSKKRIAVFLLAFILFLTGMEISAKAAGTEATAGTVAISSGVLNVRNAPALNGSILTTLTKGSYVTLISKSGAWWYVEFAKASYGYCSASYISEVGGSKAGYINTASTRLNIRSGAGTGYSIKTQLAKGTDIVIISQSNGWSKILYNGSSIGYASSAYIGTYAGARRAIQLSIPSFKQYDGRWKNALLGDSGKTINDVGCLTCCLAMKSSYASGSVIYPDAFSKQLTYTSGGAVYWPAGYSFYYGGDYLAKIYTLLQEGKPVILGAKNIYGGQHWVIVTGCSGALTASSFTINDPGSSARTNLQQLFSAYPTFYKLAY